MCILFHGESINYRHKKISNTYKLIAAGGDYQKYPLQCAE